MNILLLNSQIKNKFLDDMLKYLKNFKDDKVFLLKNKAPTKLLINKKKIDFLISFHNKYILQKNILKLINYKCINFHSSILPKNRGTDPILFSAAQKNIFGITIHKINEKVDDGDYLFQKKIIISKNTNLKKAYNIHEKESLIGFKKIYPKIKEDILLNNKITLYKKKFKNIKNSFIWKSEALKLRSLLPNKWETKIQDVRKIYLTNKKII